jgi:hypothetical protein
MQAANCCHISAAAFRITFEIAHGDFIAMSAIEQLKSSDKSRSKN